MNQPALLLKPLGPAFRTNTTQKRHVTNIQKLGHKQLLESHATSAISQAILIFSDSCSLSFLSLFLSHSHSLLFLFSFSLSPSSFLLSPFSFLLSADADKTAMCKGPEQDV